MDDRVDDGYDGASEAFVHDGDATPGDADLVAQVREGLDEPYAELYRRHRPAALSLARTLTEHTGADDVVSEAFEKLFLRIREGGGPEAAFRPYLLRTVRTVAVDASRRTRRLVVSEDPEDTGNAPASEGDELVDSLHERTVLARAFAALPERWQTFLWLSFVDDADRSEIATILGINVGSVSALGYRAREGLRRAYLDAHLRDAPTPECSEVWPLLAASIRGGLGQAQQAQVDEHLETCDHCRAALAELEAVNTRFGAVLAPIVLGVAAPAYLAAVQETGKVAAAGAAQATAPTVAPVADAGGGAVHGLSGLKALAGLTKVGAAGVAVVVCVSTVAFIGLLAFLTAPLGSEPTAAPRPGTSTTGDADPTGASGGEDLSSAPGTSSPDSSTSAGDPTSPTGSVPTSEVPTSGVPTTGGPTGQPTSTGGPTGSPQPTGGPSTSPGNPPPGPTQGPTQGPPTNEPPPSGPTGGPTTSDPSPTPTAAREVEAGLGAIRVTERASSSTPVHITVPVSLRSGAADLEITVSVMGLNKFSTTQAAGEGRWACAATTPMAGANKLGVVRCTLADALPADPLDLGMNLGYAGNASVTVVLTVTDAVDGSSSDNSVSSPLP